MPVALNVPLALIWIDDEAQRPAGCQSGSAACDKHGRRCTRTPAEVMRSRIMMIVMWAAPRYNFVCTRSLPHSAVVTASSVVASRGADSGSAARVSPAASSVAAGLPVASLGGRYRVTLGGTFWKRFITKGCAAVGEGAARVVRECRARARHVDGTREVRRAPSCPPSPTPLGCSASGQRARRPAA